MYFSFIEILESWSSLHVVGIFICCGIVQFTRSQFWIVVEGPACGIHHAVLHTRHIIGHRGQLMSDMVLQSKGLWDCLKHSVWVSCFNKESQSESVSHDGQICAIIFAIISKISYHSHIPRHSIWLSKTSPVS
jgi:hypothetical protein